MNEFALWLLDKRDGIDARKVVLEFENPSIWTIIQELAHTNFPSHLDAVRAMLQSSISTLRIYLGVGDFVLEYQTTALYTVEFIPPPRSYARVSVEENRVDQERFADTTHYMWNRMFELGVLKENKLPLGYMEVHTDLYAAAAYDIPLMLLLSTKYNVHAFGTMLALETLVTRAQQESYQRLF